MVDNPGLIFFYAAQFLKDNVYHCRELDIWAIAEKQEGELLLHAVFGGAVSLDTVIGAFGGSVRNVTLGFSPADKLGWECQELQQEDCTFFVKGPAFDAFTEKKLRIPSLAHA